MIKVNLEKVEAMPNDYAQLCTERDNAVNQVLATAAQEVQNTAEFAELRARQAEEINAFIEQFANGQAEVVRKQYEPRIAQLEKYLDFIQEEPVQPIEVV